MESSTALLRNRDWMGVVGLVSPRPWIAWAEARPPERIHRSLYLYRDTWTIVWLLYYSPAGIRQLESRSTFSSKLTTMAMAADWPLFDTGVVFRGLPRIHLGRKSRSLALASLRSRWIIDSDVQLQPLRWSTLRGVRLARISAGQIARGYASLDRRHLCRAYVGGVACSTLPYTVE